MVCFPLFSKTFWKKFESSWRLWLTDWYNNISYLDRTADDVLQNWIHVSHLVNFQKTLKIIIMFFCHNSNVYVLWKLRRFHTWISIWCSCRWSLTHWHNNIIFDISTSRQDCTWCITQLNWCVKLAQLSNNLSFGF